MASRGIDFNRPTQNISFPAKFSGGSDHVISQWGKKVKIKSKASSRIGRLQAGLGSHTPVPGSGAGLTRVWGAGPGFGVAFGVALVWFHSHHGWSGHLSLVTHIPQQSCPPNGDYLSLVTHIPQQNCPPSSDYLLSLRGEKFSIHKLETTWTWILIKFASFSLFKK